MPPPPVFGRPGIGAGVGVGAGAGAAAFAAARYGKVLLKAESLATQSVVTFPPVISASSASITSSDSLRPLRKPAEEEVSTVRMSGSRTSASLLAVASSLPSALSVATTSPRKVAWSLAGCPALKASFFSLGMKTVLIAGRAMRSHCFPPFIVRAQTPILPPSAEEGSSTTIALTLRPAKKFLPTPPGQKARPLRKAARSKKKGSS